MRHLGVTLMHIDVDQIDVIQDMVLHPKKKVLVQSGEKRRLNLTYAQAYDLKLQLADFLGEYDPDDE